MTVEIIEPGLFERIFSFFSGQKANPETKTSSRRPSNHNMTSGLPANEELLLGLYHGTYPGLEKATPLARVPINVPTSMIGIPTPTSNDVRTQEKLNEIRKMMMSEIRNNNKLYALIGTSWIFPKWDSKTGQGLIWKVLRDSHVVDVLISLDTDLPVGIVTDEMIQVTTGENKVENVRRKIYYMRDRIDIIYEGLNLGEDRSMRNVIKSLPRMFAHQPDDMVSRGHSLIEPCICDFKDYHDIDYRVSETLARFRVKQIQEVREGSGLTDWRHNNGLDDDADFENFDIAEQDLLFTVGSEKTKYEYLPEGATAAAEKTLERLAWKIVCGTETPEIFFGRAISGNLGTYAEQMQMMFNRVESMRDELNYPYQQVFIDSLKLCSIAENTNYDFNIEMGWNKLSALSEKDKADIFQKFCSSIAATAKSGVLGISQLFKLWNLYYPEIKYDNEDAFKEDLVKMGNLQQFIASDYATGEVILSAAGGEKEVINRTVKNDDL